MKVQLKLFTGLRKNRQNSYQLEVEPGATSELLASLVGIDTKEVSMVLVNGKVSKINADINDGDVISFYPSIGGG